jgi:uncharacterized membrane protein YgcG
VVRRGTHPPRNRFIAGEAQAAKEVAMTRLRKLLTHAALAATIAGGIVATTAAPASARVVCNGYHCWHTHYGYYGYDDPYYDDYYGPAYYGPGIVFGFGGGHGWRGGHGYHGGGFHGGGFHGGGFHGGGGHGGGHHH